MQLAEGDRRAVIPVDSEHSALFQLIAPSRRAASTGWS